MRSGFVEIVEAVLIQNSRKMALAKNDDVIQTLSPYAPKKAFAPGIGRDSRMQMMGMVRRKPFA